MADMIRAQIFAIVCGYEGCNDFGPLRADPAFKLACGRLPESGPDLASQPTLLRLESAPTVRGARPDGLGSSLSRYLFQLPAIGGSATPFPVKAGRWWVG